MSTLLRFWWWETLLLSRRMLLALLTIGSDKEGYLFMILMVSLCIYMAIQIAVQPFRYTRVNRMESVCILALIVVLGFVNGTGFGTTGDDFVENIVSLILLAVMVLPLLMLIYEVIQICRHSATKQVSKKHFDKIQERKSTAGSAAE